MISLRSLRLCGENCSSDKSEHPIPSFPPIDYFEISDFTKLTAEPASGA
jgi:hypothetical protein